ncbi:PTS glucose transporter subunit IIBC [Buchnera aphidicola]|uniref:PTS system glucose-specific EIICB component n=1 Tax=Buchnera aphidicola (Sarucallis kahawaluokalani) TaxID=1241878 RepID=A0A4D6YJ74_9GAMM|nr:PTS glucose transporter subunit IIBC [Buchnera aphidicola]QCI26034.1 PTS glucose transporter subunit IIBC [Buchnera aphidicola (Sarucallis kahawaluokalani)]
MLTNMFANLQKLGKSLMLPVSVLPIAGIFLGIGTANFHIIPSVISNIMVEAGGAVFKNIPLIFSIGIALGFTNNDGVAALAAVIGHEIMIKTTTIVIPIILKNEIICKNHQYYCDIGVLGGIFSGIITAYLFNKFSRIELPEYLGFFSGKRFIPMISGLCAILFGCILSLIWPPISQIIKMFSQWAAYQNPMLAFAIYGFVERILVPFGLHHIWNVPFQMQIGEYTNSLGQVFHGDIARYMAGDRTAGKLAGGFLFKMYGLPGAAFAIWNCAHKKNRSKVGGMMISAALTAFLTGITEPIEFAFLLTAPILYFIHAILAGLAFPVCIFFGMNAGTSFSHGLIDFIILSANGKSIWLFPIVGTVYGIIYYVIFYTLIKYFNFMTPGRENIQNNITIKNPKELAPILIQALGGAKNIQHLDACITRIRITVYTVDVINQVQIKKLGASGIIISGLGVQIIFGTKSDNIKSAMDDYIKNNTQNNKSF